MEMIRLAAAGSAKGQLPLRWFKPAWLPDIPETRRALNLRARIGNSRLGVGSCWVVSSGEDPAVPAPVKSKQAETPTSLAIDGDACPWTILRECVALPLPRNYVKRTDVDCLAICVAAGYVRAFTTPVVIAQDSPHGDLAIVYEVLPAGLNALAGQVHFADALPLCQGGHVLNSPRVH